MDSWSNPAFRSSQGTTKASPRKQPRIPDDLDLLTRTSWKDAKTALSQINKGKASGNKGALWVRSKLQMHLFHLGCFIQQHAGKVLFVGLLVLSTFCVGLKSATVQTNVEKLWVEEGGRLEHELDYIRRSLGEGSGSTHQIIIQTPKQEGANILHVDSMLAHLDAIMAATRVHVELFDAIWKLKDLCISPGYPSFEDGILDQIFENLMPCAIITPLDCFWEGAKILGPDFPVIIPELGHGIQWTNINPQELLNVMKLHFSSPSDIIDDFMKRAGVTTAYQNKPCLDPADPKCPATAANKASQMFPDVGAELTGGCYGFATKYMHWPEDLIVGGVKKNKTGHIIRAEAFQSVIQMMGDKEMYEFWRDNYKVHNLDWTQDKAKLVLETWQRKFSEEMLSHVRSSNHSKHQNINAFSTTSLTDILRDFSEVSITRVALEYIFMLVYACVSLLRWTDSVQSQSGIGIAGVLLVAMSVAAGLGFCAIIGIMFNASTTQIVPFLALGLGVDDMFLLAHTYAENSNSEIPCEEETGECLKQTGVSVLLTSISNMCAFFAAAIIPIPALRAFALQAAILIIFNVASMLLIFPAIVSLDMRRREAKRVDVFCCFSGSTTVSSFRDAEEGRRKMPRFLSGQVAPIMESPKRQAITRALPPDGQQTVTVLAPHECWPVSPTAHSVESLVTNASSMRDLVPSSKISFQKRCIHACAQTQRECYMWSLTWFAREHYGPFLQKTPVKVFTILFFIVVLAVSVWGMLKVTNGLDLTDIVPRDTNEYQFLRSQSKYFGVYNMFAVTQGNFDYPNNQKLLHEYHEAFMRVSQIIKDDDGALPDYWLGLMRDWLISLQKAFDKDWQNGCITQERWYNNASNDGILAYKLLVQTGHVDNPVDKMLVTQVRLVDSDGIINPKAFYNYLTAWVSNDPLAYTASQANLRPEPKYWNHEAKDVELKIAKAQPLSYTQLPFFLNNLGDTQAITETIETVREVCRKYEDRGLPNFPAGIPFTYWEQYVRLRFHLLLALICVLAATFLVISVVLVNPWAAIVIVITLAMMVVELFGFMGIIGIRLSAVPAVILIVAVGIGVEFTVHVCMGFLTSIGNHNRRMLMALEHMFAPVVHGGLSTLLGIVMLAFSEFDFIVRYFFYVLFALVVIGLLNGLLLLPVLLSLAGPFGEVIPKDNADHIDPPTPEPSPPRERAKTKRSGGFHRRVYPHVNSEISLTTITEEPPSWHSSHEIVVQPEVVVETTTTTYPASGQPPPAQQQNSNANQQAESFSSSSSGSSSTGTQSVPLHTHAVTTTKVTATAKVNVEVHTRLPGSVEREHSYKHKRRRDPGPVVETDVDSDSTSK